MHNDCSTALMPFNYRDQPVRTLQHVDGSTWWVAADVCEILGQPNVSQVCARLDDDEKGIHNLDTLGGHQEILIVSEPGLYKLILRSRKQEAKVFQRWVTHEVLPQIRKTGSYGQPPEGPLSNPVLQAIKATMQAHIAMIAQIDQAEHRALMAEATAVRAEGKADLALAELRVMTLEEFVMANGLLRQLPPQHWQSYAHWLREFCQAHGLPIRKDPVPGRPWNGENAYPITALSALLRYEQTRPRQVILMPSIERDLP